MHGAMRDWFNFATPVPLSTLPADGLAAPWMYLCKKNESAEHGQEQRNAPEVRDFELQPSLRLSGEQHWQYCQESRRDTWSNGSSKRPISHLLPLFDTATRPTLPSRRLY